jgi:hypothetical protein
MRLKIMASAIPPAIAAMIAPGESLANSPPCIEIAGTFVPIPARPRRTSP